MIRTYGGVWKKGDRLWIVINGKGHNAYVNKAKAKENHPDFVISEIEKPKKQG